MAALDKNNDEVSVNEIIGAHVRRRRKSLGLTQEKLAEQVNVSLTTISRLENGKQMVSVAKLVQVVQVLEMSFDFLLHELTGASKFAKADLDVQINASLEAYTANQKRHLLKYMMYCMEDVFE